MLCVLRDGVHAPVEPLHALALPSRARVLARCVVLPLVLSVPEDKARASVALPRVVVGSLLRVLGTSCGLPGVPPRGGVRFLGLTSARVRDA